MLSDDNIVARFQLTVLSDGAVSVLENVLSSWCCHFVHIMSSFFLMLYYFSYFLCPLLKIIIISYFFSLQIDYYPISFIFNLNLISV